MPSFFDLGSENSGSQSDSFGPSPLPYRAVNTKFILIRITIIIINPRITLKIIRVRLTHARILILVQILLPLLRTQGIETSSGPCELFLTTTNYYHYYY